MLVPSQHPVHTGCPVKKREAWSSQWGAHIQNLCLADSPVVEGVTQRPTAISYGSPLPAQGSSSQVLNN